MKWGFFRTTKAEPKRIEIEWHVMTREQLLRAAADNGGALKIVRFDQITGQLIEEVITADMPPDEIVL